jgi:hypothetical protein
VIGTAFIAEGTRRARAWFGLSARAGHAKAPARADLERWFTEAGLTGVEIGPQRGFAAFSAASSPRS